jgi:FKBP-type peptidyl-prolyl cis-trans isomerase SlyD
MDRMKISDGAVVLLHYTMTADGRVLDQTEPDQPLTYVHGAGQLLLALEAALGGHGAGDKFVVRAPRAFGERAPGGPQPIPREYFPVELDLFPGLMFLGEGRDGEHLPLWIVGVEGNVVLVEAHHPYAGREVEFAITILEVRDGAREGV